MPDKPKLVHKWMEPIEDFFKRIDECGGWPLGAASVVYQHNEERTCYFSTATHVRDGWNTSVATADDYYWWKVSKERKKKFEGEVLCRVATDLTREARGLMNL